MKHPSPILSRRRRAFVTFGATVRERKGENVVSSSSSLRLGSVATGVLAAESVVVDVVGRDCCR